MIKLWMGQRESLKDDEIVVFSGHMDRLFVLLRNDLVQ